MNPPQSIGVVAVNTIVSLVKSQQFAAPGTVNPWIFNGKPRSVKDVVVSVKDCLNCFSVSRCRHYSHHPLPLFAGVLCNFRMKFCHDLYVLVPAFLEERGVKEPPKVKQFDWEAFDQWRPWYGLRVTELAEITVVAAELAMVNSTIKGPDI